MIYKDTHRTTPASGVAISLKRLAVRYRKKLLLTFFLVIFENIAFLLYPVLAGIAINAILAGKVIIWMTISTGTSAGHIYSVMTYMWMFATSLDDAPQLLEKFSQLRDIGKRVSTDNETHLSQESF